MRLFEHPDFEQAVLRAAEHFRGQGLLPAIIEKDYYVTEALRLIGASAGDKVIFKGGNFDGSVALSATQCCFVVCTMSKIGR